jgi:hypothetical protein
VEELDPVHSLFTK